MIAAARRLWKLMPESVRRNAAPQAEIWRRRLNYVAPEFVLPRGPLVLSGFIDEVMGLGRAARLTLEGLEAAGLSPVRHNIRTTINPPPGVAPSYPAPAPGGAIILDRNPPEADLMLDAIPDVDTRYRIGVWLWETETLPAAWLPAARRFHEIWAPSTFGAAAIAPHARKTRVMPCPMLTLDGGAPDRARFGFADGVFYFCTLADARSSFARKNPLGSIAAYIKAFPASRADVRLVVKLVNEAHDPAGLTQLRAAAAGREDIQFFAADLSDRDQLCFLASIDALISMHRAEGFGLPIAEALALGKPAIATGWSANVDFMRGPAAALRVKWRLVPTQDPGGRYVEGRWAEPDLDHAVTLLRRVADEPGMRNAIAADAPAMRARLNAPWRAENIAQMRFTRLVNR